MGDISLSEGMNIRRSREQVIRRLRLGVRGPHHAVNCDTRLAVMSD